MATPFYINRGDTGRPIRMRLTGGDGTPQDLTGTTVMFRMRENVVGGLLKIDDAPAVIVDALEGRVRYDWAAADLDTIAEYRAWWIVDVGGQQISFPAAPPPDDFVRIVVQTA